LEKLGKPYHIGDPYQLDDYFDNVIRALSTTFVVLDHVSNNMTCRDQLVGLAERVRHLNSHGLGMLVVRRYRLQNEAYPCITHL